MPRVLNPDILTIEEAAIRAGKHRSTVSRAVNAGYIPCRQQGKRVWLYWPDVQKHFWPQPPA